MSKSKTTDTPFIDLAGHPFGLELYFSGDSYFRDAIQSIRQAQVEVLIESYIFDLDPIGQRFLNALAEASKRGVQTKLLVDGVGSYNWIESLKKFCLDHQINFRVYHPLPLSQLYIKRISWHMLRRLLFLFQRINKRNHRKVISIDGKLAFLGSLNISQVHSEENMGENVWRDTGVKIQGPEIADLRLAFYELWRSSKFETRSFLKSFLRRRKIKAEITGQIRLNSSLRARFFMLRALKRQIRNAKTRILITNAYFVPTASILRNLRKTAKRGVYVALCLPEKTDVTIVQLASRSLYERMLRDNIRIFEYRPRVLHAKTIIIDNWASVGSLNLNHRSLKHDLEVEINFTQKAPLFQLAEQWELDIKEAKPITYKEMQNFSLAQRWLARAAYWLRYWL